MSHRALLFLAVAGGLLVSTALASPASAHGAVSDPVARHYGCYQRWPNGPSDQTATEDPMCYQAWLADPAAMWNWNGLLRDGVGGDHQSAVPDGQLCSGGMTFDGRYAAFDPTTQRLRWSDLELAGQVTDVPTGTSTPVEVNAPGRTGHHLVYTVWQASHLDQSYYFCSDVNFTGGTDPTPSR